MRLKRVKAERTAAHAPVSRRSNPWYVGGVAALAVLIVGLWFLPRTPAVYTAAARVTFPQNQSSSLVIHDEANILRQTLLSNERLQALLDCEPALAVPGGQHDLEIIRRAVRIAVSSEHPPSVTFAVTSHSEQWATEWVRALVAEVLSERAMVVGPRRPSGTSANAARAVVIARRDELAARQQLDAFLEKHLGTVAETVSALAATMNGPGGPRSAVARPERLAPQAASPVDSEELAEQIERLRARREELLATRTPQHPELIQLELDLHILTRRSQQLDANPSVTDTADPQHDARPSASRPEPLLAQDDLSAELRDLRKVYEQAAARRLAAEQAAISTGDEPEVEAAAAPWPVAMLRTREQAGGEFTKGGLPLVLLAAASAGLALGWLTWLARPYSFFSDASEVPATLGLRVVARLPAQSPIEYPAPPARLRQAVYAMSLAGECVLACAFLFAVLSGIQAQVPTDQAAGWQTRQSTMSPETAATSETVRR